MEQEPLLDDEGWEEYEANNDWGREPLFRFDGVELNPVKGLDWASVDDVLRRYYLKDLNRQLEQQSTLLGWLERDRG